MYSTVRTTIRRTTRTYSGRAPGYYVVRNNSKGVVSQWLSGPHATHEAAIIAKGQS